MRIDLAYGRDGTTIEVPDENLVAVVEPEWPHSITQPQESVAEALASPVDGLPLAAVVAEVLADRGDAAGAPPVRPVSPGRSTSPGHGSPKGLRTCILVSDTTRPCPNREVLLPILAALRQAGVAADAVTILIATGLHEPVPSGALASLLGEEVVRAVRIESHSARRPETLVSLGRTPLGTPAVLARAWVEADLRIATGVVEPHLSAGFSGGRKAICPGIAGTETVMAFHGPRLIEHPHTQPGVLAGNPTHAEALAVAGFAPPHFTVNVTVDRRARLTGIFAGTMEGAHAAAVAHLKDHVARPVPEPADILVTTSGGRPLDATFYGAEKGLLPGMAVLKPGGTFLWAAALEDGVGSEPLAALVDRFDSIEAFLQTILAPAAEVTRDQWALHNFSKAARHGRIMLWSDRMDRGRQAGLFVEPVASLEAGLARAMERHGPQARVVVLPHGPYVLPYVET